MDEFSLIERFFSHSPNTEYAPLGVGDDCALLELPDGFQLATSVDTLVADVHFPAQAPAYDIGTRALCIALSDLAAMGAEPIAFTLAITLPCLDECWLDGFSRGLFSVADEHRCPLVGGDTTKGPLTISLQVFGKVKRRCALLRSGAQVGDGVYVSGSLGDGAAALHLVIKDKPSSLSDECQAYLYQRYYRPTPQFKLAKILSELASSAIDISDGFLSDLEHVCKTSNKGSKVDQNLLPKAPQLDKILSAERIYKWMLNGGDDYQLCFTVPQVNQNTLSELAASEGIRVTCVGEIVTGAGVQVFAGSQALNIEDQGYNHFG